MINLKENINKTDAGEEQFYFVWSVFNYMRKTGRASVPIHLVLTQSNTYGDEAIWRKVLKKDFLSHIRRGTKYRTIVTDAVADTCFDRNERINVPAKNFSSLGIDELLFSMISVIEKDYKKRCILWGVEAIVWLVAFYLISLLVISKSVIFTILAFAIVVRICIGSLCNFNRK